MTEKMMHMGAIALTITLFSSLVAGCSSTPGTNSAGAQGLNSQQTKIKEIQENSSLTQQQKTEQIQALVKLPAQPPAAP